MSYIVCRRAQIIDMNYAPGNMLVGRLRIGDKELEFRTRGHLVHAVNRHWQGSSWKPAAGTTVIIDAERSPGGVVVDSIEPFWPEAYQAIERLSRYEKRLIEALQTTDTMTKALRIGKDHDDGVEVICARWKDDVRVKLEDGRTANGVVSAIAADNEIRFRIVDKKIGTDLPANMAAVEPVILPLIGIPTLRLEQPANLDRTPNRIRQAGKGIKGSKNPNKWIRGKDYRPIGMPDRNPENVSYNDPVGTVYEDIPF